MSAETELLTMKLSAYEVFMEVIAAKLHCLPSYADPLPTKGNSHIVAKLDALLNAELGKSPNSQSDAIALCQQGLAESRKRKLVWFEHIFERIEAAVVAQQHT